MRPSRILIRVDLPAPFAPIRPVTPGATVTVSPSSAVTLPGYTLVSAFVSMTAAGSPGGSGTWLGGMGQRCQRRGARVITRESEAHCAAAGLRPGRVIAAAYTHRMTPLAARAVTVG